MSHRYSEYQAVGARNYEKEFAENPQQRTGRPRMRYTKGMNEEI
jgi:hypothetical protein